jgi:hypothetical protein
MFGIAERCNFMNNSGKGFMIKPLVLALFSLLAAGSLAWGGARDARWKKVDDAISKGLPKTAIQELEPIIREATREKAYGEAAKAIARKIVLEGNIEGNKAEEKITRMEAEIGKAPRELLPLLETILANWYWHYFQNNRWRFMQRTATATAPGKDFTTWDLPRLFAEIDRQFTRALAMPDALKKTSITTYNDLLQAGTMPDKYRPTLYDFIAQEALSFYTSAEQAAAKPQDSFEVSASSPIFAPAEQFRLWKIETTDTNSPVYKALRLYQDLLTYHSKDNDPSAFADLDLARLVYGQNIAYGEDKNSRSKAATEEASRLPILKPSMRARPRHRPARFLRFARTWLPPGPHQRPLCAIHRVFARLRNSRNRGQGFFVVFRRGAFIVRA